VRGPLGQDEPHGQNLQRHCGNLSAQNRGEAPSPSVASLPRPLPAQRGEVKRHCADKQTRSRYAYAPELCLQPSTKIDSPPAIRGRRSAERRMPTMCRAAQTSVRSLRISSAARLRAVSGRARLPALRRGSQGPSLTQLQAMLPATWNQAGVTRPIPSQSSDSTSRLGRSTEGNDARSRSGADCESARKHRTRSTLQIASGMRPS
jgi:hypothetical protein